MVNSEGLADLQGFGRAYLEWLLADVDEDVKQPPNVVFGRPQHCEAIARWGTKCLARFSDDTAMSQLWMCFRRSTTAMHDGYRLRRRRRSLTMN